MNSDYSPLTQLEQDTLAHIHDNDGYGAAMTASIVDRCQTGDAMEYGFGETNSGPTSQMLQHQIAEHRASSNTLGTFVDLGSGRGNIVLMVSASGVFSEAVVGVECVRALHDIGLELQRKCVAHPESGTTELLCGNFFEVDFPNADVIFITLTLFKGAVLSSITPLLKQKLNQDGLVVCVGGKLEQNIDNVFLKLVERTQVEGSWGDDEVHVYKRC
jgi:hypothetical protein